MNAEKLTSAREWLDAFCCAAADGTDPELLLHICAVLDALDTLEHRHRRCTCAAANSHAWVNAFAARHFKKVDCLASSAPTAHPNPPLTKPVTVVPIERGFVAAPSLTGRTTVTTPNADGGNDAA